MPQKESNTPKHYLWAPLMVIEKDPISLATFLLLYVVLGLVGVLVTLFVPVFDPTRSIGNEFIVNLRTGSLYTFTIAILTSSVALLYKENSKPVDIDNEKFKKWKRLVSIIAIVALVFISLATGIQAFLAAIATAPKPVTLEAKDWMQLIFFVGGTFLSVYAFLLATYEEERDNFAESSDRTIGELKQKAKSVTDDGRKMKI